MCLVQFLEISVILALLLFSETTENILSQFAQNTWKRSPEDAALSVC